jgi:hypothetical protein
MFQLAKWMSHFWFVMEGNVKLLLLYEQIITFGWMFFIRVLERFTMSCKHPKERYGTFLVSNIFVFKKKKLSKQFKWVRDSKKF